MPTDVILPSQGQSVETCHIIEWKAKQGEAVEQGDVLCIMETDKATFEVEAPASGILLKIYYDEGEDAPVMTRIALIGEAGDEVPEGEEVYEKAPEESVAETVSTEAPKSHGDGVSVQGRPKKTRISPRARRMADLHGIVLEGVTGSGPHGRVIVKDVEKLLAERQAAPYPAPEISPEPVVERPPVSLQPEFEDIPVRGVRKVIAERMLASVQSTAQYTLHSTAPASALLAYRKRLKESPEALGLRSVSINDLVLYAAVKALEAFPDLNSHFLGTTIRRFKEVNLGFAVDTPRGLMVPVIRNASRLSLRALAEEARRLQTACLEEKITPDELNGGTFTVSNLGNLGIGPFTPVLNPPQVAILGVGTITVNPVRDGEEVKYVDTISLSLTANHQVIDGAPGARFLQHVSEMIEQIDLILAL